MTPRGRRRGLPWKNHEGYNDPTAAVALANVEHHEKQQAEQARLIKERAAFLDRKLKENM
jgi:hypothetical protein